MHGWGWYGGISWLGMILSTIVTLAVLVGLIWLVVWAIRRSGSASAGTNNPSTGQSKPAAKDILQVRYARGEIDRDQYQSMLAEIER